MSDIWDDYAEGWDSNQEVRIYSQKAFDELTNRIDIHGLRILDFGCGTGLLTEKMSPIAGKIVAIDSSERMCSILKDKEHANVTVLKGILTQHLIRSESLLQQPFDLIVASSVFAFVDDFSAILKLLNSLLCKDGLLIHWDWKQTEQEPNFGFDMNGLKQFYQQADMRTISITEPFSLASEKGTMSVIMGVLKKGS